MQKSTAISIFTLLGLFLISLNFNCTPPAADHSKYPERPITYLVPWAAGGMTDISARAMAAVLQKAIGTPVNVVNRTGGGGVVGHLAISSAKPDGYTVGAVTVEIAMLHHMGLTELSPKDYTPLAMLIHNAAAVTVRADAPWNSLEELLAEAKEKPGELRASGTSKGGIWDLARIGMLKAAGLEDQHMPWVPSQGSSPALQELIAGGVQVVTASLSEVDALRQAGQVKTLGVMSDERLSNFSEVPTLKEQGVEWSIGGWASICAPPNLPTEVKAKLDTAILEASKDPAFTEALTQAGSTIRFMAGEEFGTFMAEQDALNGTLMRESKLIP